MTGKQVLFHGKKYIVIHQYTSGYCEIKEIGKSFNVELVHKSEIVKIHN